LYAFAVPAVSPLAAADAINPADPQLALDSYLLHVAIVSDSSKSDAEASGSQYEQGCLRVYAPEIDAAAMCNEWRGV
jgi:hypothetical protein